MPRSHAAAPFLLMALLSAGSCTSPTERSDIAPSGVSLDIISGDKQTAHQFTQLLQPIVVQLMSSKGRPVKGQVVTFTPLTGSGSVWAGSAITDAEGYAKEWWTIGSLVSDIQNVLEARTVDPVTGERIVLGTLRATGQSWTTPQIQCQFPGQTNWVPNPAGTGDNCPPNILSGGRSVPAGTTLQIRFRVIDNGIPVPGVPIDFLVGGRGTVSPAQLITGADGVGVVTFTGGQAGILNEIFATVDPLGIQLSIPIKYGY